MTGAEAFFAAAASAAATAAPYLAVAGTAMNVIGAKKQGDAAYQASMVNAENARIEAASREALLRQNTQRQQSALRTNIAKSGAAATGTSLMVLADSAAQAEIDALNVRQNGQYTSNLYRAQGTAAKNASRVNMGASLLSGVGNFANSFGVSSSGTSSVRSSVYGPGRLTPRPGEE